MIKRRYSVEREATSVTCRQTYSVNAESVKDALSSFEAGEGEITHTEIDVTDSEEFCLSEIYLDEE